MNKVTNEHYSIAFGLTLFTLFSGLTLSSTYVAADNKEVIDTVSLTVPIACTMSGTGTTHTATINPGTYSGASGSEYENGIGKTTLTAFCNDVNGFAIYAIGFTGNSYTSDNHTNLVGANTDSTINTKVYASNDADSNWSMKVTKVENPASGNPVTYNPNNMTITNSFSNWHTVPDTYVKVAEYHSTTEDSSTTDINLGAKLETTYAAYIASSQPADTYTGQVKYTMVHPYDNTAKDGPIADCPANRICYSPNANDVEGTMGQQPINSSSTSATLLASNFSRKGYGFAGWSDRYDYSNDNGAKFYGPNESISFTAGQYSATNGGLRLYAIWIPSQGSLQDSSKVSELCGTGQNSLPQAPIDGTANLDSVSALTDQRDSQTYAIAKLADGNCWMIENLRLEAKYTRSLENIALAQGYGSSTIYGSFIGLADAENDYFDGSTSPRANSLYSATEDGDKMVIGGDGSSYARMPRYSNSNITNRASSPTTNINNMYSYGNYYTWPATIADTAYYTSGDHGSTSICPNGWRIPIGSKTTINKSFGALSAALGGPDDGSSNTATINVFRSFPNNINYAGRFSDSARHGLGVESRYWSSTATNHSVAYHFTFSQNTISPGNVFTDKRFGIPVRCVLNL